jgi:hypothetical protein
MYRLILWPLLVLVALFIAVFVSNLMNLQWSVSILVPIVVAVILAFFSQKLPQLVRPVAVSAKITDTDYIHTKDATVPASGHTVQITIESAGALTVLLTELSAVVVERRPASGTLSPVAGVVAPRKFELCLDFDPPSLHPLPNNHGQPHADFPLKVSPGDPEVLDVTIRTAVGDVRWYFVLETMCLGVRRTTRIDLGGRPFRTMARPTEAHGSTNLPANIP